MTNRAMNNLEWNQSGKERLGRPRVTWRRSCEEEMRDYGQSRGQLKGTVENRKKWRCTVEGLRFILNSMEQ